jgi:hypothetical protein
MKTNPLIMMLGVIALALTSPGLKANQPDWSVKTGHQYAMVVYATVTDGAGNPLTNAGSLLSASEYGMLVGVTPLSNGPKRPLYQLKVSSDNWQSDLTYSFYDGKADQVLQIGTGPGFESGSTVGSIVEPVSLTLKPTN